MADLLELAGPGGKSETCGVTGSRCIFEESMLPKLPYAGGTNGIDTHDTNRPDNDIKSFNSPYGERNVGHRGRRLQFHISDESNESILRSPNDRLDNF